MGGDGRTESQRRCQIPETNGRSDKMASGGGQGGPVAVAAPRWQGRRSRRRRAAGAGGPQGAGEVLPPPPARCPGRSAPHFTPRRPRPRLCGAGNTPRRPARTCSFLAAPSLPRGRPLSPSRSPEPVPTTGRPLDGAPRARGLKPGFRGWEARLKGQCGPRRSWPARSDGAAAARS